MGIVLSLDKLAQQACSRMPQHELDQALADVVERNQLPWSFYERRSFKKFPSSAHEGLVSDAPAARCFVGLSCDGSTKFRDLSGDGSTMFRWSVL